MLQYQKCEFGFRPHACSTALPCQQSRLSLNPLRPHFLLKSRNWELHLKKKHKKHISEAFDFCSKPRGSSELLCLIDNNCGREPHNSDEVQKKVFGNNFASP